MEEIGNQCVITLDNLPTVVSPKEGTKIIIEVLRKTLDNVLFQNIELIIQRVLQQLTHSIDCFFLPSSRQFGIPNDSLWKHTTIYTVIKCMFYQLSSLFVTDLPKYHLLNRDVILPSSAFLKGDPNFNSLVKYMIQIYDEKHLRCYFEQLTETELNCVFIAAAEHGRLDIIKMLINKHIEKEFMQVSTRDIAIRKVYLHPCMIFAQIGHVIITKLPSSSKNRYLDIALLLSLIKTYPRIDHVLLTEIAAAITKGGFQFFTSSLLKDTLIAAVEGENIQVIEAVVNNEHFKDLPVEITAAVFEMVLLTYRREQDVNRAELLTVMWQTCINRPFRQRVKQLLMGYKLDENEPLFFIGRAIIDAMKE